MDALALSAIPNRAHDIESENQRIKVELTRSRRYHRPLSVLVVQLTSADTPNAGFAKPEAGVKLFCCGSDDNCKGLSFLVGQTLLC